MTISKRASLNSVRIFIATVVIAAIGGCTTAQKLTVDFQQGQTLKYKFVSSRNITVDWGKMGTENVKNKIEKSSESLELVVSYTPAEVNAFGLTKVKAVCESARVSRSNPTPGRRGQPAGGDAAESFTGKSWTFTVDATGKMLDRSEINDVIREVGQRAFRSDKSKGLIKDPDMIYDFIASQWFLWDSVSSIPKPIAGVSVGDKWHSVLGVPAPMILFAARDVNYQLEEIRQDKQGQMAVIGESYTLRYPCPSDWPVPYIENFMMSGKFGFLRNYKTLDLQGQGQEIFNIDAGRTEQYNHKYTTHILASMPMGVNIKPEITIEQTLTAELIEPKGPAQQKQD